MENGSFRTYYRLFEDFFLSTGFILIVAGIVLKLWGISYNVGLTKVTAKSVFVLGITSVLINIALNIQDIARK